MGKTFKRMRRKHARQSIEKDILLDAEDKPRSPPRRGKHQSTDTATTTPIPELQPTNSSESIDSADAITPSPKKDGRPDLPTARRLLDTLNLDYAPSFESVQVVQLSTIEENEDGVEVAFGKPSSSVDVDEDNEETREVFLVSPSPSPKQKRSAKRSMGAAAQDETPLASNCFSASLDLPFPVRMDLGENDDPTIHDIVSAEQQQQRDHSLHVLQDMANFVCAPCAPDISYLESKRNMYDDEFTTLFLESFTSERTPLIQHKPSEKEGEEFWVGQTVFMTIQPGNCRETRVVQPKLIWSCFARDQNVAETTEINLMNIHSILGATSEDQKIDEHDEEARFFSITTTDGDVYVFEALSVNERERTVHGLKNVIARLTYNIVLGDHKAVMDQFYSQNMMYDDDMMGDLPSLKTAAGPMNQISHALLSS
mmetsp:Transcript_14332/g.26043  ORF Transcript_14332/g.26043 Transcript_14332/m.26043 type:complete len:426 (-) Transcript_14332:528-1805(-)